MLVFKCTMDDYFHHFVFGGVICTLGLYQPVGPLQNAVGFFICGLPGGLDYLMLALVKHRWLPLYFTASLFPLTAMFGIQP